MFKCKRAALAAMSLTLLLTVPVACGQIPPINQEYVDSAFVDHVAMETVSIDDELVALANTPAVDTMLMPEASGKKTETNSKATVDYSNTADGYVMVKYTAKTTKRLKARVYGPNTSTDKNCYTYDLTPGEWTTFPLADGNGNYKVTVFEQTSGSSYATAISASFKVTLSDEFAPFLRPNQFVNYSESLSPKTLAKAKEIVGDETDNLKKVEKVYEYVVNNLTYDTDKANTVQSGYLPVLDDVLAANKGICFDYSALMTGMLRSQGVPCKLVTGYAGTAYHAWISVWSEKDGWVEGAIFFDGTTWQRMDPTFASSSKGSQAIMKYIGDGSNYSVKLVY